MATSPLGLSRTGVTAATSGVVASAAASRSSAVVSPARGSFATTSSGPLKPLPKPGGEQVVGTPRRLGRRVVAGVGVTEPKAERRRGEREHERGRSSCRPPRPAAGCAGSTTPRRRGPAAARPAGVPAARAGRSGGRRTRAGRGAASATRRERAGP